MTNEQINEAIADAISPRLILGHSKFYKSGDGWIVDCPNYCGDLNAMNEAEQTLVGDLQPAYTYELLEVIKAKNWGAFEHVSAPARQRAEAFLRALGKWEEGK